MSRIQDILSKAERDGTARRTRALTDEYATRPPLDDPRAPRPLPEDTVRARAFVDAPLKPSLPPDAARGPAMPDASRVAPLPSDAARTSRALRREVPGAAAAPIDTPRAAPVEQRVRSAHASPAIAAPAVITPPGTEASAAEAVPQGPPSLDHRLVAALAPASLAAEQYRSLRTRIKQVEHGRSIRSIAITSPAKGDGKSLTAANLALTMAQEYQQRVLLVDADLRRPSVHTLFALNDTPGLVDVLMNVADLEQSLVFLPDHHLTILPAGVPPNHPAELLGSSTMRRLLETLRSRYDRILIDVPPVAPLADLQILAPLVDGLLMIVRAGITPKPAIERALADLDPSKVLGLVLNEAGGDGADAYTYEGYEYVAG